HGAGITFSVGAGFASKGSLAAGVGGAGAIAEARAALSREAMRRSLFQRVALCSSHIGTSPSRNALTTKAGTFVSRTSPSQILTSTGFQLLIEKISNATSSKTQTIVRTIFIGRPLILVGRCYEQAPRKESGASTEHARENPVHLLEMIVEVEFFFEFGGRESRSNFGIGLEQIEQRQRAVALPHFHRVALDQPVGVFAAHAGLGQRQQHALRMDETAHAVEVLLHPLRIDEQLVDHTGEPRQREVKRDAGVGADE